MLYNIPKTKNNPKYAKVAVQIRLIGAGSNEHTLSCPEN